MSAIALAASLLLGFPPEPPPASAAPQRELSEVVVTAPEPLFVAPTRRDRIGRIWAPVHVNGYGPFRFVVDTASSHSVITRTAVSGMKTPIDQDARILLRGATGTAVVPAIPVEMFEIGELLVEPSPQFLAVVPDVFGAAQGVLGTDGFHDMRITVEFKRDRIMIRRSHGEAAGADFHTVPVTLMNDRLLVADARIGGVRAKAIIDTGGQVTLGNLALRDALLKRRKQEGSTEEIIGVTLDVQEGERLRTPAIRIEDIVIRTHTMTFSDLSAFQHWQLTDEPALLIGMDALGLLETLIIDYRRQELQIRLHGG